MLSHLRWAPGCAGTLSEPLWSLSRIRPCHRMGTGQRIHPSLRDREKGVSCKRGECCAEGAGEAVP